MDEEEHIETSSAVHLHAAVLRFFEHQRDNGLSMRAYELEAAAISAAASAVLFPDEPMVRSILRLAILSGSPRLVASLPMSHSAVNALSTKDWHDHIKGDLCRGRPDRIAAASAGLSRGLAVYDDLGLLFGQARADRDWWPLLEEIARQQPSFGCFMRPTDEVFTKGAPKDLAVFLRLQAKHYPDTVIESFDYAANGSMPALLGLVCLLPIDADRIYTTSVEWEVAGLIDRLKSNHGRLQIRAALGTLEEALGDMPRFSARVAAALPELGRRAG